MRALIQQIVQAELEEYAQQLSQQEKEITELNRRLNNMNRVGKVSAWRDDHQRIKVKFGDNETPWIKWFSACAGDVAEYRLPSIGEQAVLINVGGGDNSTTSIALIGIPSDQFPLPTDNPDEILRVYPDGTWVCYDKKKHKLDVRVAGEANIQVDKDANVNVDGAATVNVGGKTSVMSGGDATVDAPKILLNDKDGGAYDVVTTNHPCQVTGLNHMCGSASVKAGG
ncbi:phage baseplate assembly protein V [Vibrio parahaemolyticus]|uniref:phage baseplate assembly protein V n=1 Tax=Vibrio parahaemolyticus TaxID=670 RepID=UPI0037522197|nr:phage baseplate assembly protein V [Vibrio parahaemolyticus]HCG6304794.1 phage baseplate assembly protein V [Vibrio parahaemolyticus]HCG9061914.1 phage baseplate assembly protein V [Vibrio parahaemolyticus]